MFSDKKQYIMCHTETNAEAYSIKYGYCYKVIGESNEWQYSTDNGNVTIDVGKNKLKGADTALSREFGNIRSVKSYNAACGLVQPAY